MFVLKCNTCHRCAGSRFGYCHKCWPLVPEFYRKRLFAARRRGEASVARALPKVNRCVSATLAAIKTRSSLQSAA